MVRGMLKHAYESDLIDRPVKYGGQFKKPTLKEKRRSRSERDRANGKRIFEPPQVRLMLEQAQGQLRAMILLGINGGFGNTDCAELPIAALDLDVAVIEYERPKTAVQRVVPLWPETVTALRAVSASRPKAKVSEYERLVFLTVFGNRVPYILSGNQRSYQLIIISTLAHHNRIHPLLLSPAMSAKSLP